MRRRSPDWLTVCLVFLTLVLSAIPAAAQQADPRESKARELFGVGRYAEALEIYGRLYAETAHPTYLRNVGRCFQNLGQADQAIFSFREYLRQARDLSADQRRLVEGYIGEMEDLRRKRAASVSAASSPPPVAVPRPAAPPSAPAPVPLSVVRERPTAADPTARSTGTRRIVGLAVAGLGAIGAGVGVAYFVKSRSTNGEASGMCPGNVCADNKERDRHDRLVADAESQQKVAIIAVVAGGAALVGGAVWALTAPREKSEHAVRLLPWGASHEAGITVAGAW